MRVLAIAATLALAGLTGPAAVAKTKTAAKTRPAPSPGIILTATLLPGSYVNVEIPALPLPGGQILTGSGVIRQVPLSGSSSPTTSRARSARAVCSPWRWTPHPRP